MSTEREDGTSGNEARENQTRASLHMVVPPYLQKGKLKRDLVTNKTAVQMASLNSLHGYLRWRIRSRRLVVRGKIVWSPWNDWLDVIALETALMFVQRRLRCQSDECD